MKAEDYLKSRGLKNPPLDSGISGGGDAPRKRVSDIMNDYAKDQIQKDRERVKLNAKVSMVQFKTFDAYEVDKQSIDNTPIILE